MNDEMQQIVDSAENSPNSFCRIGRQKIIPFFKRSIDELNLYIDCPDISDAAKGEVRFFQEEQASFESYYADVCK